ncbi:MAG: electron transport complex subunit E [Clostridia bacterium]|nr:electron transport complex subunit E [Clostridia bacterium]
MKNLRKELTKGILKENPVLSLALGTCPTLAITMTAKNAIGMGIAATLVLVCSNAAVSLLKRFIPNEIRIPCYITIIAGFVSIVQMLAKAFSPVINKSLGIYLPLIVVNCIILGRAEMFARKNKFIPSVLDGLGMGIGFTVALLSMGIIREFLGNGTFFSIPVFEAGFLEPIIIFILPPGGFFVFGILIALSNKLSGLKKDKKKNNATDINCADCSLCKTH